MEVVDTRIIVAGLWIAVMLTYLLGDVIRIFAGHFTAGEMQGRPMTSWMLVLAAGIMLVPIVMLVLSLTVPYPAIRWTAIAAAALLVVFNLAGLPYKGAYDNFLIAVSIVFKGLIVYYAAAWTACA